MLHGVLESLPAMGTMPGVTDLASNLAFWLSDDTMEPLWAPSGSVQWDNSIAFTGLWWE